METHFASPHRASRVELEAQVRFATNNAVIDAVLNAAGGLIAVLNEHRQIVAMNDAFLATIGVEDPRQVLGFRPGEAIECIHACEEEGGCGTARPCATCGAAIAIVTTQRTGRPVEQKCVATVVREGRFEDLYLDVRAVMLPDEYEGHLLLFLHDITTEQNRAAFDRVFFHDLVNTMSGLVSAASLLDEGGVPMDPALQRIIVGQVKQLDKEVEMQRMIRDKGDSGFSPDVSAVPIGTICGDMESAFSRSGAAIGKKLSVSNSVSMEEVKTDRHVLLRILMNMLTNAAEATPEGGEVRAELRAEGGRLLISVWNEAFIPPEVASRVFQRNFSTKTGSGRGLGTYSMRLFAQRCLDGDVSFVSTEEGGTTFTLGLPLG